MTTFRKVSVFFSLFWHSYALAAGLSLHDKIGQMLIMGFEGKTITKYSPITQTIQKYNIGGVILFDYNAHTHKYDKNIESPTQVKTLTQKLQHYNTKANQSHYRDNLPLLISVDYEGGKVNRLAEKYGFPITYSAKTVGQMLPHDARSIATAMAHTLNRAGFNLNFAPVLDMEVNLESPIIAKLERSFSADPSKVTYYGKIFSSQFLKNGVQCAYKHFPGHGSAQNDSHLGFVDVTNTWHEEELIPFQQSLSKKHCGMIMTAHIVNRQLDPSGLPATLSYRILTGILRDELGFDGVIVTDDMQMKAIVDHYGLEKALTLAINAGADMVIFGNQLGDSFQDAGEVIRIIEKRVAMGEISPERINEAYEHILKLKNSLKIRTI